MSERPMCQLDRVGLITDECDAVWGSKRRYPTREAFVAAVKQTFGFSDDDIREVRDAYMRRGRRTEDYDTRWVKCPGPARGATAVWEAR